MKDYPNADVGVMIVWTPMVRGDDEAAARESSGMFDDARVHQFWDANRRTGTALSRDVFPRWLKDAAAAMPTDHALCESLKSGADKPPEKRPLWDITLFYTTETEWKDSPPKPDHWSKQLAYFGMQEDGTSGLFWRNDFAQAPVASDWPVEVTHGMTALIGKPRTGGGALEKE